MKVVMSKLFSGSEKHLLDTILTEKKEHEEDYVSDYISIKKSVVLELETNPITSTWKFTKQYYALKYLNLV